MTLEELNRKLHATVEYEGGLGEVVSAIDRLASARRGAGEDRATVAATVRAIGRIHRDGREDTVSESTNGNTTTTKVTSDGHGGWQVISEITSRGDTATLTYKAPIDPEKMYKNFPPFIDASVINGGRKSEYRIRLGRFGGLPLIRSGVTGVSGSGPAQPLKR